MRSSGAFILELCARDFPCAFLYRLGYTGNIRIFFFFQKCEKKSSSRPFQAQSGGGQETLFYLY